MLKRISNVLKSKEGYIKY